jgi:hypothetical protein
VPKNQERGGDVTTATRENQALEKLYKATKHPEIVNVPKIHFLMIDGLGDPNSSVVYKQALEALYTVSYTLKFALKKSIGLDFKVSPLEGLWWADDMEHFSLQRRDFWQWTMMIAQPLEVRREQIAAALEQASHKKALPGLEQLRFEHFFEGMAAQVLHIGPYASETPTILALHAFIRQHHGQFDGQIHKHHEIYLSDPRRAAPEKLKTIIRQPFIAA